MEENYYKTLDIPENSSMDEIKRAYRKLSLKHHPDKNIGNPDSVNAFHKINSAFEILGDTDKKRQYDMTRNNPFFAGMPPGMQGHDVHIINMDDLISQIFFNGMRGGPHFSRDEDDNPFAEMFSAHSSGGSSFFGPQGGRGSFQTKPSVITKTLEVDMAHILDGCVLPLVIERNIIENHRKRNETATVYVNVPQGIDDNEVILLPDEGHIHHQCKGDVKVFIKIINHTEFKRRGLDLLYDRHISLKESLCGFSFPLKYINGKTYTINNQRGNIIPNDFIKIIPKMGITRESHKGNLVIRFIIDFPPYLTEEQINTLSVLLP
jgi:DnaJ-class molecular chaperone